MEDIYMAIFRIVFGIITLVGILWGGLQYMIKYLMFRCEKDLKSYMQNVVQEQHMLYVDSLHNIDASVYDMNIHMYKLDSRICAIEKSLGITTHDKECKDHILEEDQPKQS